ncbi:MAG: M48 family metallopeptidase [Candidatus Nomurabacteria bacterium]|nr:M48 family metallopeptidase [Candidatus Nomurabacteria bacterium]
MEISYVVKNNRHSRGVRISVHMDGSVVVTKSLHVSARAVEELVEKRKDWILEKIAEMAKRPKKILAHFSVKEYKEFKELARVLVNERLKVLNQKYKFEIGSIAIRNQKTRWGSCSGKKNLNFNYKLFFLPPELADYIIVHELCHLKEMNHSKRFWDLVALQVPDHKEKRRQVHLY